MRTVYSGVRQLEPKVQHEWMIAEDPEPRTENFGQFRERKGPLQQAYTEFVHTLLRCHQEKQLGIVAETVALSIATNKCK